MHDHIGFVRANGEGAGEATTEIDFDHPDARSALLQRRDLEADDWVREEIELALREVLSFEF